MVTKYHLKNWTRKSSKIVVYCLLLMPLMGILTGCGAAVGLSLNAGPLIGEMGDHNYFAGGLTIGGQMEDDSKLYLTNTIRIVDIDTGGEPIGFLSAEINPAYNFSLKRFQPFIGCGVGLYFGTVDREVDGVMQEGWGLAEFSIRPNVGFRFYLTNRFAVTGDLGVRAMTTFGSGPSFTLGLSYKFSE